MATKRKPAPPGPVQDFEGLRRGKEQRRERRQDDGLELETVIRAIPADARVPHEP